jgi:hypothetical protein
MVFTNARNTTRYHPSAKAAAKMKNFVKKPANGGMPPNENRASVSTSVRRGFVR